LFFDFVFLEEFPELFEDDPHEEPLVGVSQLKEQEELFNIAPQPKQTERNTSSLENQELLKYFRCKVCGSCGTSQLETSPQPHYWYYDLGGAPFGPFSFRSVAEWLAARYFGPTTRIARCIHDGKGALMEIDQTEVFCSFLIIIFFAFSLKMKVQPDDESADDEAQSDSENEKLHESKKDDSESEQMEGEGKEQDGMKVWKTNQLKKIVKETQHDQSAPKMKKKGGKHYRAPPEECFVECRRYPEFSLYLAEGTQVGQRPMGPPSHTTAMNDKSIVQDVAVGIVQTIYDTAKNIEALEAEADDSLPPPEPVPEIPVPVEAPKITVPEQYQEYPSKVAFNELTGRFEGNLGAMYDYRMFTMTNRTQQLQKQLSSAAKSTAVANSVCSSSS
jgi:hypothetical protein